jgi:hypothetical protein
MAYVDALINQMDPTEPKFQTQGGTFTDPRWTNGTWGTGEPRNTGISGIMNDPGGIQAPPLETTPAAPTPAPAAPKPTYAMQGFEAGKLADPNKQTEKYQLGRVFQGHDPKLGVTEALLAELNALDIGDFSGGGDKLTVANSRNGARFGAGGTDDVIKAFKAQNGETMWDPWEDPALAGPEMSGVGQSAQPGGTGLPAMDVSGKTTMTNLNAYEPGAYLAALLAELGVPA